MPSKSMKPYRPKPPDEIRRNMSAIRSNENRTELALRRALHRLGLRFRKYRVDLPGRPDIVFAGPRVAVFVDGDYWHAREMVEGNAAVLRRRLRRLAPEAQRYWNAKFTRRVERDAEVTRALRQDGWRVLRFWESDVRSDTARFAQKIEAEVRRRTNRKRVSRPAGP